MTGPDFIDEESGPVSLAVWLSVLESPYRELSIGLSGVQSQTDKLTGKSGNGADPYTRTGTRALDGLAISRAGAIETSQVRAATPAEDWAIACCLWPVLVEVAREFLWSVKVELLLEADLPVGVYDLAVDVLHPPPLPDSLPPRQYVPRGPRPWAAEGFNNHRELITAMRKEGYTGPTNRTMPDLWAALRSLRDGLTG